LENEKKDKNQLTDVVKENDSVNNEKKISKEELIKERLAELRKRDPFIYR
jgi:hypothetical protein